MTVRCKFVCQFKDNSHVAFAPVYSGSDENKQFFAATPGGEIRFYCVNPAAMEQFVIGKEYYVDIQRASPDEETAPAV